MVSSFNSKFVVVNKLFGAFLVTVTVKTNLIRSRGSVEAYQVRYHLAVYSLYTKNFFRSEDQNLRSRC